MSISAGTAAATTLIETDICIIGGGAAGLEAAFQAAVFGQRVVLIERHRLGGDSLNYGAVPARALAKAAARAKLMKDAASWGFGLGEFNFDRTVLDERMAAVRTELSITATVERLRGLGIRVLLASARFIDSETVLAGEDRVRARRFIIATGSAPKIPAIEGLANIGYFTSETLLAHRGPVAHLAVIGGGATALALAQTYARLGSQVTVLESGIALGWLEKEFAEPILKALRSDGVTILEGFDAARVNPTAWGVSIESADARVTSSHVLVASGHAPALDGLGLAVAGVKSTPAGIAVNRNLQTTNSRIYAIGDVTGRQLGTDAARAEAGRAIRKILFRFNKAPAANLVPQMLWTDPGFAQVGLTEAEAAASGRDVRVLRWAMSQTDEAIIEGCTAGHVKVVTDRRGRVVGASILAADAREQIGLWALAIAQNTHIASIAALNLPYPSMAEAGVRAAQTAFSSVPSNPIVRKIIALLAKLG